MGCPGALAQYLRALFGQKENFNVYFSNLIQIILVTQFSYKTIGAVVFSQVMFCLLMNSLLGIFVQPLPNGFKVYQ